RSGLPTPRRPDACFSGVGSLQWTAIMLAEDHELRLIRGLWYEVRLAPLPKVQYRAVTECPKVPLKPYARRSRAIDMEITERRLVSPPVFDMARGARVPVGPDIDNEKAWCEHERRHPDGRYAISK
ncbi:MAG TPA: hypothetical protein VGR43_00295, partial [Dehalococcoidia bacterium]|nr:hypothetical protein [Dehalococcoidia bacterium]